MVRAKGLEPPHLSIQEPKSCASTSSATPAKIVFIFKTIANLGTIKGQVRMIIKLIGASDRLRTGDLRYHKPAL